MNFSVKIGNKSVGVGNPCFISFEPSATYTNFVEAKKMIELTAMSGADAIKFQTFLPNDSDRIMGDKSITVDFSTNQGKKQELVYDALKRRELSKDDWKNLIMLTKEQKDILYEEGTESPGSSSLNYEKREGSYFCAGCGTKLFESNKKYDSGTGWPSFFEASSGVTFDIVDFVLFLIAMACFTTDCRPPRFAAINRCIIRCT